MNGVFVTGTGTGVGKTIVAAATARAIAASGAAVAVFKPAVTGLSEPEEPDHEVLRRAAGSRQTDDEIAPYRFDPPASPHLAAELAGVAIDPARLVEAAKAAAAKAEAFVCEGVGGLLVPLTPGYLVRDFARDLGLPLVVVSPPDLGTVNHTLLTVEAARAVGLEVACVVLTPWPDEPGPMQRSNEVTVASLGAVPVERLSRLDPARPETWPGLPAALAAISLGRSASG